MNFEYRVRWRREADDGYDDNRPARYKTYQKCPHRATGMVPGKRTSRMSEQRRRTLHEDINNVWFIDDDLPGGVELMPVEEHERLREASEALSDALDAYRLDGPSKARERLAAVLECHESLREVLDERSPSSEGGLAG